MDENYWQLNRGHNRRVGNNQDELVLAAFQGLCYKCGKQGHKAINIKVKLQSKDFMEIVAHVEIGSQEQSLLVKRGK
jgi:hypothetical protein